MARRKFSSSEIAVAIESFVTADNRVVKRGGRLRGDDPAVALAPHLFVRDGSSDEEIGAARAAQLEFLDAPEPADPDRVILPEQLTMASPHALVATKDASFILEDRSIFTVRQGDLVDDRQPWVSRARRQKHGNFRKPTRDEKK